MKSTPKWLMIPPAAALLLLLGPIAMGGSSAPATSGEPSQRPGAEQPRAYADPAGASPGAERAPRGGQQEAAPRAALPGSLVPRTPDLWQMSSALVGVLLLGGVALLGLKKLRGSASPQRPQTLATLRQTMRLGAKSTLHAIEFDDRILLVGDGEKGLTLIESSRLQDADEDEATVLARSVAAQPAPTDEGATPKNLLIPRPDASATPTSKADIAIAKLNDFRALLDQASTR